MKKKVSVITINLNNASGLLRTIESVKSQSFGDCEFIVIDGGSTDGSKDVLNTNKEAFDYYISETDKGVYHAMNKGIKRANSDYIIFMNSGDSFYDANVLEQVFLSNTYDSDFIYGDVVLKHKTNSLDFIQKHPEKLTFSYFYRQTICQQACFFKTTLFERFFYFNENYKICSDWEFLIRAIFLKHISYQKVDVVIANYDMCGMSSSYSYREISNKERKTTISKYFSGFEEDYEKLMLYSSKRFQMLKRIERSPFLRKVVSRVLKFCLILLPKTDKK